MILVNEPLLAGNEEKYVLECLRTGWISSSGGFIERFEERWAGYCGRKYGVAVSNGTTALQAAVGALGLAPGDEVIMPTFTIISCALAVIYNGSKPVLVDSDPDIWTMDVDQVEAKITPRTKAIMPVHIYGHPVDMDRLEEIASRYSLAIIEDAAEAHGTEYLSKKNGSLEWRKCGSFGELSCFSFYANKPVTTGEGGMVLTDDEELAYRCREIRNLCFIPERRFYHRELGHNYRLTNLQAAIGLAQVERIDEIVAKKRQIGRLYTDRLSDLPGITLQIEKEWARSNFWMFGVLQDDELPFDAVDLASRLKAKGVETRPFFLGMHEQPAFHSRGYFAGESYPVSERLARRGLYLPSGMTLDEKQIDFICQTLREEL